MADIQDEDYSLAWAISSAKHEVLKKVTNKRKLKIGEKVWLECTIVQDQLMEYVDNDNVYCVYVSLEHQPFGYDRFPYPIESDFVYRREELKELFNKEIPEYIVSNGKKYKLIEE